MYKTILILLIILLADIANSQPKPDPKEADIKTYALYNAGKWDELAEVCEKVIDNGIDFFYLRLRAGIAYYNKADYLSATGHFEKALKFSPTDNLTMEYLYYSYLFSGRESDALSLIWVMPFKLKKKLDVYSKFIYGVYAEGGYTTNTDFSEQKKKNKIEPPNIYNEQTVSENGTYISLNLRHQFGKNVTLFHGYNNVSVSNTKQNFAQTGGQKNYDYKVRQDEYYFNLNFRLGRGFDLATAFHYLNVKYDDYNYEYNGGSPKYTLTKNTLNDFSALLSITKYTGYFKLGLKNSISNLNRATQVQNTAQIILYPLGSLNFYTITDATLFSEKEWGSTKYKSFGILNQKAGWKVFDFLWMEAGHTFGNIYNFTENDAYIIFNNVDRISNRTEFTLISPVSRHIELSLRYQFYNQEVTVLDYTNLGEESTSLIKNSNHKIIGGLKWTF